MSNPPSPSPLLPRRAVLAGSLAAVAGIPPALGAPVAVPETLPESVRDAIALCRRAGHTVWVEMRAEVERGYEAPCEASRALHLEIEHLRAHTLAKSPKTWEDVAVLAVLALYWERGELQELVERTEPLEDPEDILIGCGDRPLPSAFLALVEVLGLRLDLFPPDGPLSA